MRNHRHWGVLIAVASVASVAADETRVDPDRHRHGIPSASMYDTYGYQPASTAAGSAMNGLASVISSKGDYNLSTSEAAENLTQAQSKEIENRQQYTDTYFQMQETNRAEREKLAGPKPTEQQLVKLAKEGVPRPLGPTEMDPVSGALIWPDFLQTDVFKAQRDALDQMFAKQANYGALSYSDQTAVRKTVDAMFVELKQHIREVPPPDYLASRDFLNSLLYAATKNELP